jgi:hypothetical protein
MATTSEFRELLEKIQNKDKIFMDFVMWTLQEPGFHCWFPDGNNNLPDIRFFRVVW